MWPFLSYSAASRATLGMAPWLQEVEPGLQKVQHEGSAGRAPRLRSTGSAMAHGLSCSMTRGSSQTRD